MKKNNHLIQTQTHVFARNENNRIAYYKIDAPEQADLWDKLWETATPEDLKSFYAPYRKGYLGRGTLPRVFIKHLPTNGVILEGGCGMAQYVLALRTRGYDCVGVDFAASTVVRVKTYLPDTPVTVDDILNLQVEDKTFAAYISLGVMEHFQEGPDKAIKEAYRVLKKGGLLLVSIPQVFKWRKERANSQDTPLPENASFYQYAFSVEEFGALLKQYEFEIISQYGYHSHYALRVRFPLFAKLLKRFPRLWLIDLILDRLAFGRDNARMRMYVARKF